MPAQSTIKVCPPQLLQAASSVAATVTQAAQPEPRMIPAVGAGSASDAACAAFAAGVGTRAGQLTAKLAGKGPQVETTTQSGATQLQGEDEDNAARIQAVGQWDDDDWFTHEGPQYQAVDPGGAAVGPGRAGLGPVPHSVIQSTGFSTGLGDGWDDDPVTEAEQIAPPGWSQDYHGNWSPPIAPIGGGAAGGGGGRAPI